MIGSLVLPPRWVLARGKLCSGIGLLKASRIGTETPNDLFPKTIQRQQDIPFLYRCPTCRHELGNIRCLALEKVDASLELPCKYQGFGCVGIYPYYNKLKHESQCAYKPYNCLYAGSECTVIGDIPYLVAHLKDDHKVDMPNVVFGYLCPVAVC